MLNRQQADVQLISFTFSISPAAHLPAQGRSVFATGQDARSSLA